MTRPRRSIWHGILAIVPALVLLGCSFGPRFTDTATRHSTSARVVQSANSLRAPYSSQYDGSVYADSNCGVATLAMTMGVWGHSESLPSLREWINDYTGIWDPDAGIGWEALVAALNARGFGIEGLYVDGGYRRWSLEDVRAQVRAGHPVIALAHWQSLPGHAELAADAGDHYVVLLGVTADGQVIYHDSSLPDGAYRLVAPDVFTYAWSHTWAGLNYTALGVTHAES